MPKLEDLVRHETANSSIAFRERAHSAGERAEFARDILALANADTQGQGFLFLGVRDTLGGRREVRRIERTAWAAFKDLLGATVGVAIEPALKMTVRSLEIDGKLVGTIRLLACDDAPYLVSDRAGADFQAGCGWIRRGTETLPLRRADLERMFESKTAGDADVFEVVIGFAGDPPQSEIALAVLPLDELPSAVAAQKLHKALRIS